MLYNYLSIERLREIVKFTTIPMTLNERLRTSGKFLNTQNIHMSFHFSIIFIYYPPNDLFLW